MAPVLVDLVEPEEEEDDESPVSEAALELELLLLLVKPPWHFISQDEPGDCDSRRRQRTSRYPVNMAWRLTHEFVYTYNVETYADVLDALTGMKKLPV